MSAAKKHDFVARARAAWGDDVPGWIVALAEEANRTSGSAAAARIGYSPATVSQVLSRSYPGDLDRIQEKVAGALMGATVSCEVYGDIPRDRCLDLQQGFSATSSARARVYSVCRSGRCPHSRIKGDAA